MTYRQDGFNPDGRPWIEPVASPLPEEPPRKCPACGTNLIPASQAFSEIRERITAEEPQGVNPDFDPRLRDAILASPPDKPISEIQRELRVAEEPPESLAALLDGIMDDYPETAHKVVALFDRQREEIKAMADDLMDWENREAAVCPEDFGFAEYIASLSSQLERLKAEQLTAEEALQILRAFSDAGVLSEAGNETRNPLFETFWVAVDKLRRLSQQGDTQE